MSWSITNIHAKDFMSFEGVSLDIEKGCFLIQAENKDDKGQQSNGGGKSSLMDIVPVCFLGQSVSGRNLKDCINYNNGAKFFECSLNAENSITKDRIYIKRIVHEKKSSELIIKVNDKVPDIPTKQGIEDGVDIAAGNEFILNEILQIDKDDLLNYYFTSEKHHTPFLKASNTAKMEVISRFANISDIDNAIEKLSNEKCEIETEKNEIEIQIREQQAKADTLNEISEEDLKERKDQKKKGLLEDLNTIDKNNLADQNKISELSKEIQSLHGQIESFPTYDLSSEEKALEGLYLSRNKINKNQNELQIMVNKIEASLKDSIECPKCKHQFVINTNEPIAEVMENMNLALELVTDFEQKKEENKSQIEHKEAGLLKSKEQEGKIQKLRLDISQCQHEIKIVNSRIDRYKNEIRQINKKLEKVEQYSIDKLLKENSGKIKNIQKTITELEKQKSIKENEIHKRNQWVRNFEDFKYYVINQPIETICSNINHYLGKIGSDFSVLIEGFKKLKNGKIRQKLNPIVYRNGLSPNDYPAHSSGEKARLNIATDLAFQHIINQSKDNGGLNWYQSDELLSPVDSFGISEILKSLEGINKSIWLVSHSTEMINYDKVINIVKENGSSKIICC